MLAKHDIFTYKEIKKKLCLSHGKEQKYGSNSHVFVFFDHLYFSIKYVIFLHRFIIF